VVHACNPRYSGGGGESWFEATLGKLDSKNKLKTKWLEWGWLKRLSTWLKVLSSILYHKNKASDSARVGGNSSFKQNAHSRPH
jgi:hypothetical protein